MGCIIFIFHSNIVRRISQWKALNRSAGLPAAGKTAELTRNELQILACLITHAGQIVSRADLIDALWDNQIYIDDYTGAGNHGGNQQPREHYSHLAGNFLSHPRNLYPAGLSQLKAQCTAAIIKNIAFFRRPDGPPIPLFLIRSKSAATLKKVLAFLWKKCYGIYVIKITFNVLYISEFQ